jgi:hypothetical protein
MNANSSVTVNPYSLLACRQYEKYGGLHMVEPLHRRRCNINAFNNISAELQRSRPKDKSMHFL